MQTNDFLLNEKNQSSLLVNNVQKNNDTIKVDLKEEKGKEPKFKKTRYWEPLIPRSRKKDRLEIW